MFKDFGTVWTHFVILSNIGNGNNILIDLKRKENVNCGIKQYILSSTVYFLKIQDTFAHIKQINSFLWHGHEYLNILGHGVS